MKNSFTLAISDPQATYYAEALRANFPKVRILAACSPLDLRACIGEADALATFGVELNAELIDKAPRLRWIQALSSGTDRIEPLLINRKDILLTSARGAHGAPVSEMAIMLMLALARRLPMAIRNQDRHVWSRNPGTLLYGKTVGIAGMGVIGKRIATVATAFGMKTIGFGSLQITVGQLVEHHLYSELKAVASDLDFLVVVTPLRADTVGMIDRAIFNSMKRTAVLVNVSRGAVVNEDDLVAALREKLIAGAAIDAFREEPLSAASPFWSLSNVIITPHIGGDHDRYAEMVAPIIATNLRSLLEGREVDMVNKVQVGDAAR